jgi:hypothetical protein
LEDIFSLLSGKNIFWIEILSLPVRSGGASFHFAQNDNELGIERQLMGAGLEATPPTQPPSTAYTTKALSFRAKRGISPNFTGQ